MNAMTTRLHDPRTLADEIRELAARAYETLRDPLSDAQETRKLSQRIAELQDVTGDLASDELSLWLKNLHRRVNASTHSTTRATKPGQLRPTLTD